MLEFLVSKFSKTPEYIIKRAHRNFFTKIIENRLWVIFLNKIWGQVHLGWGEHGEFKYALPPKIIWPWSFFPLDYPKNWPVNIQRQVSSLSLWINCQTSLLLQLRGYLPSESRVPEVIVLWGTPETVEMLNLKWLVQNQTLSL